MKKQMSINSSKTINSDEKWELSFEEVNDGETLTSWCSCSDPILKIQRYPPNQI